MSTPTFEQLQGMESVRRTTSRMRDGTESVFEVFHREDDTYWWVQTLRDSHTILQVEPVTVGGALTYHEIKR